jgi:hypothetical protein
MEPFVERQVRIVEARSLDDAELLFAIAADVEDSGRYGLLFEGASLGIFAGAGTGVLNVLRDFLAIAVDAFDAFGLAHLFQEIVAGFGSGELFGNVYQVHVRPLDVVCPFPELLSSR